MNAGLIVFIVLIVLAFLGLPIFEAIAAGTMLAMWFGGFPLETMAQKTFLGLNSSSLLSIPFFILAGNLMARGITQKLIGVADLLTRLCYLPAALKKQSRRFFLRKAETRRPNTV